MRESLVIMVIAGVAAGQTVCTWSALSPAPSDIVLALVEFDDGSGPAIYAAGGFMQAGGAAASRIARWDGSSWSPVGAGAGGITVGTTIFDMIVFDDGGGPDLYVAGSFSAVGGAPAAGVARWDGFNWTGLGTGLTAASNPAVHALAVFDDGTGPALYAGGVFTVAGGLPAANVARWDGASWSPLGAGVSGAGSAPAIILGLAVHDDGSGPALYAAGDFAAAGGVPANSIARWDGASWAALAGGLNSQPGDLVLSMASFDDGFGARLYAGLGALFSPPGGAAALGRVCRFDGLSWSTIGATSLSSSNLPATPEVLSVEDDGSGPALFLGGRFDLVSGVQANALARWNGSAWSAVESGLQWTVLPIPSLVASITTSTVGGSSGMFVGGNFNSAGGIQAALIARRQCLGPPSIVLRQPGGAGTQVLIQNQFTMPGNEYLNLYSLSLCPGGVGTGPFFGLCAPTLLHRQFLLSQALLPLGTPAFHFAAGGRSARWGPFALPPLTLDAVTLDITGGSVGQVSAVSRFTVQ